MKSIKSCTVILVFIFFGSINAQVPTTSELFKTLKANDSLLFDVGFNTCNLKAFEALLAPDLEFYHDTSGITNSKAEFIVSFRKNICGNPQSKSQRTLIPGTLEVFPLYNNGQLYGAIQKGEHRFFQTREGQPIHPGSAARFTHLWLKQGDAWQIKRVLSYDHRMETSEVNSKEIALPIAILQSYAGTYLAPKTGRVTIKLQEGALLLSAGKMKARLVPSSETTFFQKQAQLTFEFVIATNGKVEKLIVSESGTPVEEAIRE